MTSSSLTLVAAPSLDSMRTEIDAIDQAIGVLLLQRAEVSQALQIARVTSGGTRVDLAREREVIETYVHGVGPLGRVIARAVLEFCRGKVTVSDANGDERQS